MCIKYLAQPGDSKPVCKNMSKLDPTERNGQADLLAGFMKDSFINLQ